MPLRDNRAAVRSRLARVRKDALDSAGKLLLAEANETVPLLDGDLRDSGDVEVADHEAAVYYDTPYAQIQHENTTYNHAPGRRAKWLELTLREQSRAVERDIEATYRRGLR
jgi:hypothetical protein